MAELYSVVYAFLVAQMVENLPAMLETRVLTLGQEFPVEKGMATQSSILAWKIPCTEEPGGLQSKRLQRVGHNRATITHTHNSPLYVYITSPLLIHLSMDI